MAARMDRLRDGLEAIKNGDVDHPSGTCIFAAALLRIMDDQEKTLDRIAALERQIDSVLRRNSRPQFEL